jgi:hypothetical protein
MAETMTMVLLTRILALVSASFAVS